MLVENPFTLYSFEKEYRDMSFHELNAIPRPFYKIEENLTIDDFYLLIGYDNGNREYIHGDIFYHPKENVFYIFTLQTIAGALNAVCFYKADKSVMKKINTSSNKASNYLISMNRDDDCFVSFNEFDETGLVFITNIYYQQNFYLKLSELFERNTEEYKFLWLMHDAYGYLNHLILNVKDTDGYIHHSLNTDNDTMLLLYNQNKIRLWDFHLYVTINIVGGLYTPVLANGSIYFNSEIEGLHHTGLVYLDENDFTSKILLENNSFVQNTDEFPHSIREHFGYKILSEVKNEEEYEKYKLIFV